MTTHWRRGYKVAGKVSISDAWFIGEKGYLRAWAYCYDLSCRLGYYDQGEVSWWAASDQEYVEGGPGDDTLVGIVWDTSTTPDSDADGADTLEGWAGADEIVMGNGDHAWGEFATANADGATDTFISGTWITGTPPVVHDYDPLTDQLVLYYEVAVNPAPVVTVNTSLSGGVTTHDILLDGVVLMQIDAGTATYTINPATDVQLMTL